jgi:hypothetical protein
MEPTMTRAEAERKIIEDWKALPENERQTDHDASFFAMKIKDKYPFKYGGDRYQAVHAIISRYRSLHPGPQHK